MNQSRIVKKKQIILYQGETTSRVFKVTEGIVRAYTTTSTGNEVIVSLFGPGDYFPAVVSHTEAPVALFFYEMMADGELDTFTIDEFLNIQAKEFDVIFHNKRFVSSLLHVNALVQTTAYETMAHTLRYLALRFGQEGGVSKAFTRINIKLTQQDLAELANLSRETANIELNRLKNNNVVVERSKYYSVSVKGLNKVIGDELYGDIKT